jgi:hypothetical protein
MENGSTDSLTDTLVSHSSLPKDSAQTAQNNVIRETVETERKYVQDLEIMQVCTSSIPSLACPLTAKLAEIFHCAFPSESDGSRYNSLPLPEPQQTPEFSTQIPHSSREYRRAALARTTMGPAFP